MKFLQGLVLFKILSIEPIYFMFLRDLVSSKTIVIPTIIFTLEREEVLILCITNKPKLLVLFHEFWFIHAILYIYIKFRGVSIFLMSLSCN